MTNSLSKAANQFGIDLFQCYLRRHGDKYKNLLLCPYLIYHSLAMMLVGARGQTEQQLLKLLRLADSESAESRHKGFLLLTEQLLHGNHEFVHLASFVYLDKSAKRNENFKSILRDYYETKPKKVEFDKVDVVVKTINEDVARTTENIYHDILSKQEAAKMEKSYMLLVSAVFFRGFWLSNFTNVTKANFYKNQSSIVSPIGSQISDASSLTSGQAKKPVIYSVNMMSKLDYLPIVSDDQLDAKVIRMSFEASDLHMMLILPNNKHSDAVYICEKITAQKIECLIKGLDKSKSKPIRITMPKFCIDSGKISIQSTLVHMGASELFDKDKANLSGVCDNKQVWLHRILHRCFIICDNRGSITSSSFEKARKRQAEHKSSSNSKDMIFEQQFLADHPFMYIVYDSVTKTILLMGLYTDPSETLEVIHENELNQEDAHQIYTEGVYKT